MDNQHHGEVVERIEAMTLPQLLAQRKSLEEEQADPFPDDDLAGDVATSNWLNLVNSRISELEKRGKR